MKDWEVLMRLAQILIEMIPELDPIDALNLAYVILEETTKVDHYAQ